VRHGWLGAGVVGICQRHAYEEDKRAALELRAKHIACNNCLKAAK